jgi:hypothetical protein
MFREVLSKYYLIVALGTHLPLYWTPASSCITELRLVKRREVRKPVNAASMDRYRVEFQHL